MTDMDQRRSQRDVVYLCWPIVQIAQTRGEGCASASGEEGVILLVQMISTYSTWHRCTKSGGEGHRVDRLLGVFSSRPNWDSPPPPPPASVSPPLWFWGRHNSSLRERGVVPIRMRSAILSESRHFVADIVTLSKACTGILITYLQSANCANLCRHKTICNKYTLNMQSSYALNRTCALYSYIFYSIHVSQPLSEVSTI